MEDSKVEKQSKRTLSYLIGVAIMMIALMAIALFLMLNWAKIGIDTQEMREENLIEQEHATP